MGTNYHWNHDSAPCPTCGHGATEEIHIGKSSCGWTFSFHGTENIRSWKQWQTVLESAGKITNEYGEVVPFLDFRKVVEDRGDGLKNHFDYCAAHQPEYNKQNWKDDEGYSFSPGEFS